jgi:ubiquinone/menaquinone biosynthesis C-methylase UbiE
MQVFNDYNFLAKYVRPSGELSLHQRLVIEVIEQLNVKTVLDVGGGTTSYVSFLGENHDTAIVDLSEKSLVNLKAKMKIVGMLPALPFKSSFDFVSALELIEHLEPTAYDESLQEIARLSSQFVFITAPFLQDLFGAYVLCEKCGTEYQCEGHWRSFNLKEINNLQKYFGGLVDIYFIGKTGGNYFLFMNAVKLKRVIRRILQKVFRKKYCYPPFTKCPECGEEIFNDYNKYLDAKKSLEKNVKWWRWENTKKVSGAFGVLYDKNMPYIQP